MTDKKTEALKLALEALNRNDYLGWQTNIHVREAIREALAKQPAQQQEPVVWMYVNKSTHETKFQKHMSDFVDHSLWSEVPLYGEPLANHELQCVCGAVWLGDEMVHLPDKRPPAQQEPVAWKDRTYGNLHHQDFGNSIPLYASPPAQQQEPVAKVVTDNSRELIVESLNSKYLRKGTKLYTSPPASKPWVGLTGEEIERCMKQAYATVQGRNLERAFAHAIEAKLKEKNT